ncbi:MAG: PAS domain S-box protein, partial [Syntrophaceae bacterium]|nr:PAS domain S-box protein [Syntrophaceae bacterium]
MNEHERTNPELAEENALLKLRIQELERSAMAHAQTEEALQKSEANYRHLFENAPSGIFQANFRTGKFTKANDAFCAYLGYGQEEIDSLSPYDVLTDEGKQLFSERVSKMLLGNKVPENPEYEIIERNGKRRWVQLITKNFYDSEGLAGADVVAHDITKRKHAEEALQQAYDELERRVEDRTKEVWRINRELQAEITKRTQSEKALRASEQQFRGLIEKMPNGMIMYEGTKIRYLNPACEKITGYTRSELYLTDIWALAHPEYKDIVREYVKRRRRKEPVQELHAVKIVTKSGEERWVERAASAIELEGKPVVLVTITDITERRRAEEALKKSEKIYRVILENCSDAILLADEQGKLVEANRMAEELLGYTREELLQVHYTQLHPATELERTVAAFKDIVQNGHGDLTNGAIVRKGGTVIPVDITATVIEYDHRKVLQASFRDISEHKNAKDILERLVGERTAELSEKNKHLAEEVKERKRTEAALRNKTKQIQLHSSKLQELNTALKVLLKQREEDKRELEEKVLANVKELLIPYLEELKK